MIDAVGTFFGEENHRYGGSAGGISALCSLLKELPQKFSAPILAVIHVGEEGAEDIKRI